MHRNIHKYNLIFTDGKTHNQTDHVLIYKRQHSSIFGVWSLEELTLVLTIILLLWTLDNN